MSRILISFLIPVLIAGCQITSEPPKVLPDSEQKIQIEYVKSNLRPEVDQLNYAMLKDMANFRVGSTIAVMTFIAMDSMSAHANNPQEYMLGQQISESLSVGLTTLGFNVIEHRRSEAIRLKKNESLMLSSDPNKLQASQKIDYVISGTYTVSEKHFIVNAKLIDLSTNIAVAAASRSMPIEVLWSDTKVKQRAGMLYRSEY
ncbi:FlgO family outer membrane protein [Pseudoalteromonas ulvae]|uniref:FlgO domain-containing protein n=1 Tax=Pseudoalteromonas ulvae TaxID=107327 RepID=A0A244CSN3_PSEDV|nr:FlgO family outer membrane protein [Pseudoalteromonas ulvae]OUL58614.1 hypothetical protein B1199_09860 [Pseudoalteromonas ulvae]